MLETVALGPDRTVDHFASVEVGLEFHSPGIDVLVMEDQDL